MGGVTATAPSSRFDLVDMAEALAAAGFLVAAPEFAESLSSPDTIPSYSRPRSGTPSAAPCSASRDSIVSSVLSDIIRDRFGINQVNDDDDGKGEGGKIAIVGQSAGAGTATSTPGRFARVAIAGFRPPSLEVGTGSTIYTHQSPPLLRFFFILFYVIVISV